MQRKLIFTVCKIYHNSFKGQHAGLLNRYSIIGLNRRFSTHINKSIHLPALDIKQDHILLKLSSSPHSLSLNHLWLRDHCRCDACYNFTTNQRILDLLSIPFDIHPTECRLEDKFLVVVWPDGHRSKYSVDWLRDHSYDGHLRSLQQRRPTLWDKSSTSSVARVDMADYMSGENGFRDVVKSIVDFGVAIIENVPASIAATKEVVVRMAPVQNTLFGGMWEFSDVLSHSDTAYTRQALGAHTDNTYFNEAAGLQVFHCLHHDGEGGENLLVDGFRAAQALRETRLQSYDILTSTSIQAEYLEPGQHYSCTAPVLRLQPLTTSLEQVRFNLYDRAPMSLPLEDIQKFYEALRLFATEIQRPSSEWWIKLKPGLVIFIDNWRVLHGRAAYTGSRTMGGCYVNRSDFLSKARVLGYV